MPTKVVAFMFSVAGTQTWVADQDYTFLGAHPTNTAGTQVVTTDPSQTSAEATTPTTTRISYDILYGNNLAGNPINFPTQIPIPADTTLYVKHSQAGSIYCYFDYVTAS